MRFPRYSRSQIGRWISPEGRAKILGALPSTRTNISFWRPHWPELEELLLKEFLEQRGLNHIIKRWWFRERAEALFVQLYPDWGSAFLFSNGWFAGFLKRNGISSRCLTKILSYRSHDKLGKVLTKNSHKSSQLSMIDMFETFCDIFGEYLNLTIRCSSFQKWKDPLPRIPSSMSSPYKLLFLHGKSLLL